MSIIDQNDLNLQCENQFWVRARVIVDTESIRSLAFDIQILRLFDDKPEIHLHQKILNASIQKTITSWYKNYSWKKVGTRYYQVGVQKDPPLVLKGLNDIRDQRKYNEHIGVISNLNTSRFLDILKLSGMFSLHLCNVQKAYQLLK